MELANGLINKFFSTSNSVENKYFVDETNVDKINNYVLTLSDEIPERAIVLDIGCAQGKFGKELIRKNCTIYGIEKNEYAAKEAAQSGFYKEVFVHDIESSNIEELISNTVALNKIDCIILSDILEHLANPTNVLIKFSKILKKDGLILISVPNISNLDIVLHLLKDEFNYTDLGILDNTHLKFFTKKSFVQWIDQINKTFDSIKFDCEFLGNSFYMSDYTSSIQHEYPELYEILINLDNYNVLQLFFKLKVIDNNEEAVELNRLLEYQNTNVIDILGKKLQGKNFKINSLEISQNERLWINQKNKEVNQHLSEALKYIKSLEEENGKKYAQISTALDYINELEKDNKEKYIQHENLLNCFNEKDNENKELIKKITDLSIDCENKQKNINEALDYIKQMEIECSKKQNNIDEALVYIKKLEEECVNKQQNIDEAVKYINSLEETCSKNKQQIEEALDYINKLESHNSVYYNKMNESMKEIENLQNENKSLSEKMESLQVKLNQTYETIFNMENSLSWKLTKPLRLNDKRGY